MSRIARDLTKSGLVIAHGHYCGVTFLEYVIGITFPFERDRWWITWSHPGETCTAVARFIWVSPAGAARLLLRERNTAMSTIHATNARVGLTVRSRGQLSSAIPVGDSVVAAAGASIVLRDCRGRSAL